ncbi:hypothetical protein [Salisediminibacterium beveridgei]|uniref:hypothetical protein n=1 Tax=Salisediminibacterium beveridgei TaxID=632773 RepID=UPI0018DB43DA|nr:hypothetical protein [Salisediminibacterium beveridgei]
MKMASFAEKDAEVTVHDFPLEADLAASIPAEYFGVALLTLWSGEERSPTPSALGFLLRLPEPETNIVSLFPTALLNEQITAYSPFVTGPTDLDRGVLSFLEKLVQVAN